ncbi:MAG: hypothetical protein QNJ53_12620 [Pleurocapsa sp. MO_192.B19]|nr:hypothetical protein [Pleurocapsa sp. MO_192.B19]
MMGEKRIELLLSKLLWRSPFGWWRSQSRKLPLIIHQEAFNFGSWLCYSPQLVGSN